MRVFRSKIKNNLITFFVGLICFSFVFSILGTEVILADEVSDIQNDLTAKEKELDEAKKEVEEYQGRVDEKVGERRTLEDQIAAFDNQIRLAQKKIDQSSAEIEIVGLEIKKTELEIVNTESRVVEEKKVLGELLQIMSENDRTSLLEMVLMNDTLSDFFNEASRVEDVERKSQEVLVEIKGLKGRLEIQHVELENKEEELHNFVKKKEEEKIVADSAKNGKEDFLVEVKEDEEAYKEKLVEAEEHRADVLAAQNDMKNQLAVAQNAKAKEEAKKAEEKKKNESQEKKENTINKEKDPEEEGTEVEEIEEPLEEEPSVQTQLAWPVGANSSGNHPISAYFHDPTYPWRHLWEHNGVDFPKSTGSPVYASEAGTVISVIYSNSGYGNYIMILHENGMATLYAHLSSIGVSEGQEISRSQMIGGVGSTGFSSGPHLHFTVFNSSGVAINPLPLLIN